MRAKQIPVDNISCRGYSDGFSMFLEEIKGIRHKTSRKFKLTVYDGRNATIEHFMAMSGASCPAILHISSHGKYSGNAKTKDEDAMALSILALSGANVGSSGVLTAADISRMNLRGCDLAVLSACESGLGALGADGVFGLHLDCQNAMLFLRLSRNSVLIQNTTLVNTGHHLFFLMDMNTNDAASFSWVVSHQFLHEYVVAS